MLIGQLSTAAGVRAPLARIADQVLLAEMRERANKLWNEVEAFNAQHPISKESRERLFFCFGQYLQAAPNAEAEVEADSTSQGADDD